MHLERLHHAAGEAHRKATELYRISFPPHEQREPVSQENILSDEEYHFCPVYDETVFIGLILYWEAESFLYVEHFCILPEMRNRKYGQKVLELLSQYGKTVILEIDPPVDTISVRRKGFYERCGFVENPYPHTHPPYHAGNDAHELLVMSSPAAITQKEYDTFSQYLTHRVMKDAF